MFREWIFWLTNLLTWELTNALWTDACLSASITCLKAIRIASAATIFKLRTIAIGSVIEPLDGTVPARTRIPWQSAGHWTKPKTRHWENLKLHNVPDIQKVLTMMASTWFHHCSHIGFTELQLKDSATPTPCNLNAHACKHFAIYIIINHHHKLQTSKRHLKVKCRAQGFSRGPKIVPFKKLTKKWSS